MGADITDITDMTDETTKGLHERQGQPQAPEDELPEAAGRPRNTDTGSWDVFISHATEDKEAVARPLAILLNNAGLRVWMDEGELTLGDSLRRHIDRGLAASRYGIVILSSAFFAKSWPLAELDALFAREHGGQKVILPVRHGLAISDIQGHSPFLASRLMVSTADGLEAVVEAVVAAIRRAPTPGGPADPPGPGPASRKGLIPASPVLRLIMAITVTSIIGAVIIVAARCRMPRSMPAGLLEAPAGVKPPPRMAIVDGAVFEMGTRSEERDEELALCGSAELKYCKEKLARETPRTVAIKAFFMDLEEVTVAEFAEWLHRASDPESTRSSWFQRDLLERDLELPARPGQPYTPHDAHGPLPVTGISWVGADAYCRGQGKRLPTEAEWELAARSTGRYRFPWGKDDPCRHGTVGCCELQPARAKAPARGESLDRTANEIRNLAGNVSEWVSDAYVTDVNELHCREEFNAGICFAPHLEGDPKSLRAVRGGEFTSPPFGCRGALRASLAPLEPSPNLGFRCAKDIE